MSQFVGIDTDDMVARVTYTSGEAVSSYTEEGRPVYKTIFFAVLETAAGYRYGHFNAFEDENAAMQFAAHISNEVMMNGAMIDLTRWHQMPAVYGSRAWKEESYILDQDGFDGYQEQEPYYS